MALFREKNVWKSWLLGKMCERNAILPHIWKSSPMKAESSEKKSVFIICFRTYTLLAALYEILACMFYEAFLERRFVTLELFPPYFLPNAFGGLSSASSKLLSMKKGSFFLHYEYRSGIFLN